MKDIENNVLLKNPEIKLYQGNILDVNCDCIVNAANEGLLAGGGVCGVIFRAAGYEELTFECQKIGYCKTGEAVITSGCNLKQKYIIHAVGPIYRNGDSSTYLRKTYESILKLADEKNIKSVAIPAISTGIYGYPKKEASEIAFKVAKEFKGINLKEIIFVTYEDEDYYLYKTLLG